MTEPGKTEPELSRWIAAALDDDFSLLPEVWLREPLSGISLRIDYLATPRNEEFPFDLIGIEVKGESCSGGPYNQALKQCIDYRRCVVDDERAERTRGLHLAAVFLFRGHHHGRDDHQTRFGAVRMAGKFNVGEAVLHPFDGLRLEIADSPLWSSAHGLTGNGASFPSQRRIGNGVRRAA